MIILSSLIQDGKLKKMNFFIGEVDAEQIPKISQQIITHGGFIVDTIWEASHVLKRDHEIDMLTSITDNNFIRLLSSSNNDNKEKGMDIEKESPTANQSLVHWIYYPDSYDEYVDSENIIHCANKTDTDTHNVEKILTSENKEHDTMVTAKSEVLPSSTKKWYVNRQFVTTCDIFNEWGNEKDFEMKLDELNKCDKYVCKDLKIKSNQFDSASGSISMDIVENIKIEDMTTSHEAEGGGNIKTETEKDETNNTNESILIKIEDRTVVPSILAIATKTPAAVGTGAGVTKVTATEGIPTSISVTSLSNLGVGMKRKADGTEENTNIISIKQKKNSKKNSQSLLKLPIWFKFDSVNYLEIRNLPEFFSKNKINSQTEMGNEIEDSENNNNSRTEEYMQIRNFIVNLYSQNPFVYLSATECRKKIAGDVCTILRIHVFLDSFSLINFNVKADCRPTLPSTSFSSIPTLLPIQSSSSVSSLPPMTGASSISQTPVSISIPPVSLGLAEDQSTASITPFAAIQGNNIIIFLLFMKQNCNFYYH